MKWILVTTAAFTLNLALTRGLITMLVRARLGQSVRDDGPESHLKKSGTPTMGGIAFFCSTLIVSLLTGALSSQRAAVALAAASLCFAIGFADDFSKFRGRKTEGIKARYRFAAECILGLLIGYYLWKCLPQPGLLWLPRGLPALDLGWFIIPFAALVFVGAVNAVNFTDGLDGLLGGCALTTIAAYAVFVMRFGDRGLLPILAALAGALAGFLWFNAHPARIFMGDTGSLFIGALLASVSILTRSPLFLLVVGFIYVAEALSVVIQVASFRLTGRRVFRMSPIHHHFELSGWPETHVVLRFWIFSALCAAAGVWLFCR